MRKNVLLAGKNKIADVFSGSADASILVLTDDANGDALFVDDIYTASGNQTRFSQINEIKAGAGDDIVDMTSERYAYTGSEITIHGGSGNDSMHGGGGNDIFTFGDDWGSDTVKQLASGSVTVWFEEGSESNWNAETGVYTDGTNTVSVSGSVNVTLRFGASADLPAGSFEEETTRKVFEDKGMLA